MSGSVLSFDSLDVLVLPDADALAAAAADDIAGLLRAAGSAAPEVNAMFATGNSQLAMLDRLVRAPDVPWSRIRIFHMDEYVGIGPDHPAGFARYIRERIVERLPEPPLEAYYVPSDPEGADDYAARLRRHPLDVCVLGIGENGHLAFNDPPVADFDDPLDVKVVELDAACRRQQVGEGHFATIGDVPSHALTVTVPALLRARSVVVVCPDARKAPAVRDALTGPIGPACPASFLRRIPHARLYLDRASASGLGPPG